MSLMKDENDQTTFITHYNNDDDDDDDMLDHDNDDNVCKACLSATTTNESFQKDLIVRHPED
eukprot:1344748-Ditylum_brightwellii.AAC.1